MPLDQRPLEKVSEAVSVACVGQEVEPPSIISLELAPEDNSSTLVLGLASDGHLAIDISEYLVPSMNQAVLRCIASNGEGSSQTKQAEIKLEIIRKLASRLLQNLVIFLRSSNNGMQPFQLSMMSLHLLSLSTFGSFSFLVVCCLRVAASFVFFSLPAHLPAESTPSIASIKTNKAVIVIFILASVASIL